MMLSNLAKSNRLPQLVLLSGRYTQNPFDRTGAAPLPAEQFLENCDFFDTEKQPTSIAIGWRKPILGRVLKSSAFQGRGRRGKICSGDPHFPVAIAADIFQAVRSSQRMLWSTSSKDSKCNRASQRRSACVFPYLQSRRVLSVLAELIL